MDNDASLTGYQARTTRLLPLPRPDWSVVDMDNDALGPGFWACEDSKEEDKEIGLRGAKFSCVSVTVVEGHLCFLNRFHPPPHIIIKVPKVFKYMFIFCSQVGI
jgi:hypothetical protein